MRNVTISSLHYITLNPGIEKVDVVVSELNYGCLPEGSNRSELVFDFLLHQLSGSDYTHDYKLCRTFSKENEINQLNNCCKVASGGYVTICAEYSSIVLEYGGNYITAMVMVILYVGLPLIYHFLRSIPMETKYYDITDSPMALSTIFYTAFLEGSKNPVVSLSRRFAFSLLVVGIICLSSIESLGWIIGTLVWCFFFTLYDFLGLNDAAQSEIFCNYKSYLEVLTLPLNIKVWWKTFKMLGRKCACRHCERISHSTLLQFLAFIFFAILYLLFFVPFCIFVVIYSPGTILVIISSKQVKHILRNHRTNFFFKYILFVATCFEFCALFTSLLFSALSFGAFLNFMLYWIAGIYLNGSFYGPFFVPLLTFLVYSWRNWRSYVEEKYFALLTKVYEVCEKLKKN